jgi:hypothetical protein
MPEPGVQRQVEPEEEETLQPKPLVSQITPLVQVQRQEEPEEEEEPIQAKPLSDQITPLVQRQVEPEEEEEEEPIQAKYITNSITQLVQREVEPEEEEELERIQTKPLVNKPAPVTTGLQSQIQSLKGGGQPLPGSERAFFEPRFGADFSNVRIHNDSRAAKVAQSINARAFTLGRDVVFGAGQYSPGTTNDKRLLAHELVHIIQQTPKSLVQREPLQKRNYSRRFKKRKTIELLKKLGFKSIRELATYSFVLKKELGKRVYDWKWRFIMRKYYNILKNDPIWKYIRFFHIRYEKFVAKTYKGTHQLFGKDDHKRYEFLTLRLVKPWKIVHRNNLYTIYDPKGIIWFRLLLHSELFEALKICVKAAKRTGIVKPVSKSPAIDKPPWTESEIIKAGRIIYKRQFTFWAKLGSNRPYYIIRPRMMMVIVGLGVHIARNWKSFWGLGPISGIHGKLYRELCKQRKRKKSPLAMVESIFNNVIGQSNRSITGMSVRLSESNISQSRRRKIIGQITNSNKGIYIYDFEYKKLY